MELMTLDDKFQPAEVIDYFKACVWTERYSSAGDVTLVVPDNARTRAELPEGGFLSLRGSPDVMQIETRFAEKGLLTVSGPSLTQFLSERIARNTYLNTNTYWVLNGTPGWIAARVVRDMCMAGGLMAANSVVSIGNSEIIDFLELGPIAPGVAVEMGLEYGDVYSVVKTVCDSYGLGFRMYAEALTETTYRIVFTTYVGKDRTSAQSINKVVKFSPAMDNLANATELRSLAGFKTSAYAWAPNIQSSSYYVGFAAAPGVTNATRNFKRRSLMVQADDINANDLAESGLSLKNILNQRARDALANNNYTRLVDGEVVPQPGYEYNLDFFLGDDIELSGPSGGSSTARIVEFIRSQDDRGYKAYPTLSVISE